MLSDRDPFVEPTAAGPSTSTHTAGRDSHGGFAEGGIAPQDWDLMFRAALEVLERVAAEKPARADARVRLHVPPGTVLRDCIDALDQLRRCVPTVAHRAGRPAPGLDRHVLDGQTAPPSA